MIGAGAVSAIHQVHVEIILIRLGACDNNPILQLHCTAAPGESLLLARDTVNAVQMGGGSGIESESKIHTVMEIHPPTISVLPGPSSIHFHS